MDKDAEKEFFNHVYGGRFHLEVVSEEAPDFIINDPGGISLGVEITEIYADPTDARLKNHDGYLSDLLDGKAQVFRADKDKVDVDDIKIIKGDGSGEQEVRAVIRSVLPFDEAVNLVGSAIEDKNNKATNYLKRCDEVDLIINETSSIFHFEVFEDFHKSFFHKMERQVIHSSPFREVYLIFRLMNGGRIFTPLKANLFLSDLHAIEGFISDEEGFDEWDDKWIFEVIFAAMFQLNHSNFSLETTDEIAAIHFGAWCYVYEEERKVLRDYSSDLSCREKGDYVGDIIANISEIQSELALKIAGKRKDVMSCVPIYFPVEEVG